MKGSRRSFLRNAIGATALVAIGASSAAAQVFAIFKGIATAIGLLASALGIAEALPKWLADKRCDVPPDLLEDARFRCDMLLMSIVGSDGVKAKFVAMAGTKVDAEAWHNYKVALGAMLQSGIGVVETFNKIASKLDKDRYPGARSDLEDAYRTADELRAAITHLASLPDDPTPDMLKEAGEMTSRALDLAEKTQKAQTSLRAAINDRQDVKCP